MMHMDVLDTSNQDPLKQGDISASYLVVIFTLN